MRALAEVNNRMRHTVIRAGVLGYCMGVRRAVDMADAELRAGACQPHPIYTMGPLIHNPPVLERLKKQGAAILDEENLPEDLRDAVVIIRAHGITPQQEAALTLRGARLVDATCPKVRASQMQARALTKKGYRIFLAGEGHHGELIGIQGYAPGCLIAANREEAETMAEACYREAPQGKTALLGQTTISPDEYQAIGEGIKKFFPDLTMLDTICGATRDRQYALRDLCKRVDAVIVAGGRESANTRRLLAIAQRFGKPAWLVETSKELPPAIAAYPLVGLSAGASTPDEIIDAIEQVLEDRCMVISK
ncbi:MAG: 4-hydroxy-3-methylbut-2-enyl diphosphate reductase [Treponema sp.]|nr:4-hydroxy-3-methylbut-2-enyl diphosphate reductase [Treponema sp.]